MPRRSHSSQVHRLVIVLGDQLDPRHAALDGFDPLHDVIWMAEVREESTHVWSHKARTTMFLAAMRHFRVVQESLGRKVHYRRLDDAENTHSFAEELRVTIHQLRPQQLVMVEPGDYRVRQDIVRTAREQGIPLEILNDRHFISTIDEFRAHAAGRKQLRLEFFYRELRKKTNVLMREGEPEGGQWNYDADNRQSFGKQGPPPISAPRAFPPDAITQEVLELVERFFPDHPGSTSHFDWPVTPEDAQLALADFIQHRLARFGEYQDAMWTNEPYLYHSRISAALNLHLLDPRDVIAAAENHYRAGKASLAAVEGFIRQILGWREYVRGIYWLYMPEYGDRNALDAQEPLPDFFWTADTEMNCLRQAIGQTLEYGYAHHIQRLMVTGLFSLLLGVNPRAIHEWYLAVYVDAIEWVELPNVIGMSQFADGGVMASKPYVATGKYIERMSNYCKGCRYSPAESTGPRACPFTTFYWDFLIRHQSSLQSNTRMAMQLKNLGRLSKGERDAIQAQATHLRERLRSSGSSQNRG